MKAEPLEARYAANRREVEAERAPTLAAEVEELRAENDQLAGYLTDAQSEVSTLKARVEELEAEAEDTYRNAYDEGQAEAKGAQQDLWRGMLKWFSDCKIDVASDDGDGHTAQQMMDAVHEAFGDLDRTVSRLESENAALKAERGELVAALESIRDMEDRPYEGPQFDRAAVDACPECQRYAGHPIQHGICDEHRRPFYAREKHDAFETRARGYRASSIARALLSRLTGGAA